MKNDGVFFSVPQTLRWDFFCPTKTRRVTSWGMSTYMVTPLTSSLSARNPLDEETQPIWPTKKTQPPPLPLLELSMEYCPWYDRLTLSMHVLPWYPIILSTTEHGSSLNFPSLVWCQNYLNIRRSSNHQSWSESSLVGDKNSDSSQFELV